MECPKPEPKAKGKPKEMKRGYIQTKGKKRKYKKKSENKKLTEQLDKMWAEIVRAKDGPICPCCQKRKVINAHHIMGRRKYSTRWDINNGVGLCGGCHINAHQFYEEFRPFLIRRFGEQGLELLRYKAMELKKYDMQMSLIELAELHKRYVN